MALVHVSRRVASLADADVACFFDGRQGAAAAGGSGARCAVRAVVAFSRLR